ncbi:Valacyclovir hydrolase, partial [Orchesella cincta]
LGGCKLRLFGIKKFQPAKFLSTFRERKIRVLDLDINYIETLGNSKDAHPILILPGGFGSIQMDIKPILPALDTEKFKWIGWDSVGHGKSRPPNRPYLPTGYGCSYEFDVKYATELMKKLEIDYYTILAWSGGGVTGMMMANLHPERISSLVTWGTFGFLGQETNQLFKRFRKIGSNGIPDSRRIELIEIYGEKLLQEMWHDAMTEMIAMCESNVYREGGSFEDVIKNIQCPTLIIHGTKDTFFPVSYAHHLNSTLANSRLHIVKNGTHNLHLRQTHEFVNCIQNFVESCLQQDQLAKRKIRSIM